jgi:hypothetical protein
MQTNFVKQLATATLLSFALTACADVYYDRRDAIHLSSGNSNASNIAVQTIDPWPRVAGNRDIPGNGDRMAAAGERYRTGKVTSPKGLGTSSVEFQEKSGSDSGAAK